MEISKGMIMFYGGIAGLFFTVVFMIVYIILTKKEARKLMNRIDKEL